MTDWPSAARAAMSAGQTTAPLPRASKRWRRALTIASLCAAVSIAAFGCSDDGKESPTPDPAPSPDPNPDPDPGPVEDAGMEDSGEDVPDELEDAPEDVEDEAIEGDAPEMEDVDPEPDAEPDPDPDTPLDPRPELLVGGVSLFEAHLKANFFIQIRRGNAGAAFVEPQPDGEIVEEIGACDLVDVNTGSAPPPFGYNAGPISLSNEFEEAASLTPEEQEGGSFVYASSADVDNDTLFAPGSTVRVRGEGGNHVRRIRGEITTPEAHEVIVPVADSTVTRDALEVVWSRGGSDHEVVVNVSPLNNSYAPVNGPGLTCVIEGDPGTLTIPAEAMARLQGPRLAITVIKLINQDVDAGEDTFVLNATYAAGNFVLLQR